MKQQRSKVSFATLSSLDAPVSFWRGIPFGLQHVLAMFVANLAPIFLVAAAGHMSATDSARIIQSGLLVAGLGTCLQLYGIWRIGSRLPMVTGISFTYVAAAIAIVGRIIQSGLLVAGLGTCLQLYGIWRIGSRLPMVTGISFTYVAAAIAIVGQQGYGAVVGAVLVGGLLEVALGLTAQYWARFVPPVVSAVVVTSIGFSLLSVGAESFGGGSGAPDFGSWQNLTLGTVSLVACLAFQLLMKGVAKQLSVLFGARVHRISAVGRISRSARSHWSHALRSSCS